MVITNPPNGPRRRRRNPFVFTGPSITFMPFSPFGKVAIDPVGVSWGPKNGKKKNPPYPPPIPGKGRLISPGTWAYVAVDLVRTGFAKSPPMGFVVAHGARPALVVQSSVVVGMIPRITGTRADPMSVQRTYERWKEFTRAWGLERLDAYTPGTPRTPLGDVFRGQGTGGGWFAFDVGLAMDLAWVILGPPHPMTMLGGPGFERAMAFLASAAQRIEALQGENERQLRAFAGAPRSAELRRLEFQRDEIGRLQRGIGAAMAMEQAVEAEEPERAPSDDVARVLALRARAVADGKDPDKLHPVSFPDPGSGSEGSGFPSGLKRQRLASEVARRGALRPYYESVELPTRPAPEMLPPEPLELDPPPREKVVHPAVRQWLERRQGGEWRKPRKAELAQRAAAERERKRAEEEALRDQRRVQLQEERRQRAVATGARPPVPPPAPIMSPDVMEVVRAGLENLLRSYSSQAAAARALGISQAHYSELRRGTTRTQPSAELVKRIFELAGRQQREPQVRMFGQGGPPPAPWSSWAEVMQELHRRSGRLAHLAELLGIDQRHVSSVARGKRQAWPALQARMLELLSAQIERQSPQHAWRHEEVVSNWRPALEKLHGAMSRSEVARRLGVNYSLVRHWQAGHARPAPEIQRRIVEQARQIGAQSDLIPPPGPGFLPPLAVVNPLNTQEAGEVNRWRMEHVRGSHMARMAEDREEELLNDAYADAYEGVLRNFGGPLGQQAVASAHRGMVARRDREQARYQAWLAQQAQKQAQENPGRKLQPGDRVRFGKSSTPATLVKRKKVRGEWAWEVVIDYSYAPGTRGTIFESWIYPEAQQNPIDQFRANLPPRKRNRDNKWKKPPEAHEIELDEALEMPLGDKAAKKYRRFHATDPDAAMIVRIPDGKSGVTRKGPYVALGHRVETIYQVPWQSNKNESTGRRDPTIWFHEHSKKAPPMILLDPETGTTMDVGGEGLIDDWYYS